MTCLGLAACGTAPPPAAPPVWLSDPGRTAFTRVLEPPSLELPRDHGPHFDHQTEWWYLTGHVVAADGRRFGYQLTFFRRGLSAGPPAPEPTLATNQFWFAHFALIDVAAGTHRFFERASRGADVLAGGVGSPLRIWIDEWELRQGDAGPGSFSLQAREGELSLELRLESLKPLVRHGRDGLSPKSVQPGNASAYVSYTRMVSTGRLGLAGESVEVSGESWFDHEWSTSALGPEAVGWDWFSLQLDDGTELMLFDIRNTDGRTDPVSSGTAIARDGRTRTLGRPEFEIEVLRYWTSPENGARYPAGWRLRVPSESLDLRLEPVMADQEMRTVFAYWEGAVRVTGERAGRPVSGRGFVELTGYAGTMQGVF